MTAIPLYPSGNKLKDLIIRWKNKTNSDLLCTTDFVDTTPIEMTEIQREFYNSVVKRWYFSEIGFDSDEEFIYRFNAVWNENFNNFSKLYELLKSNSFLGYIKTLNGSTSNTGTEELEDNKSSSDDISKESVNSGTDTENYSYGKNIREEKNGTTTSNQTTSNIGKKYARAIQNEDMNVSGENVTTVADSGMNFTEHSGSDGRNYKHGKTTKDTITSSNSETNTSSKTVDMMNERNYSEIYNTLSKDLYDIVFRDMSIFTAFALRFEKLFIGVF